MTFPGIRIFFDFFFGFFSIFFSIFFSDFFSIFFGFFFGFFFDFFRFFFRIFFPELLKALEDRLTIQRRAVDEVLPKVIADEKVIVSELRSLAGIPDFSEKSLNELRVRGVTLFSVRLFGC
jgi:hypothetical protein